MNVLNARDRQLRLKYNISLYLESMGSAASVQGQGVLAGAPQIEGDRLPDLEVSNFTLVR